MPNKVQIKIPSAAQTLGDLWVCDILLAKAGDTLSWESSGQEMILFIPAAGLFENQNAPAEQRIFNIAAGTGNRVELRLKAGIGEPEETMLIPYAVFRVPAVGTSDFDLRAKMIIKRSGG